MGSKLVLLATAAVAALAVAPARAAQPYTVTELKPLDGTLSYAFDVNLSGQSTGVMTDERGPAPVYRGFFYDPRSGLVDIGDLGGKSTFALALNDNGLVTGSSQTPSGAAHAFLYTPGVGMKDLGAGSGTQSFGNDVDEAGNVIGSLSPSSDAFFWTQSGGIQARGPGEMIGFDARGAVFGQLSGMPGRWSTPLAAFAPFDPLPPTYTGGAALDGNIFGQSTGVLDGPQVGQAFYWSGKAFRLLDPPGAVASSTGQAINDASNLVVHGLDPSGNDVVFFYRLPNADPVLNGDSLNPPGSPFSTFLDFTSIDDVGHIAGAGRAGSDVHGFILTPPFSAQADTVGLMLEQNLATKNPFWAFVERMRRVGLASKPDATGCFEFRQLRQSLSVSRGVPFSEAQRGVATKALTAVLEGNQCANGVPGVPVTVPHIFTRKKEREQIGVRLPRSGRFKVLVEAPAGAKVEAVNVPKTAKKGTLRITIVALKLLNGTATPVTTKVTQPR